MVEAIRESARACIEIESILWRDPGKRGVEHLTAPGALDAAVHSLIAAKNIALLTGFPILSAQAWENDGPLGAVALIDGFSRLATPCVLFTDIWLADRLQRIGCSNVLGFPPAVPVEIPAYLAQPFTNVISIERPGRSLDGLCYNMRGRPVSGVLAPLDDWLLSQKAQGVNTIAIGDGGNEIGMGNVHGAVVEHVALGATIASVVGADHLITAGVSNWGAWGILAGLEIATQRRLLPAPDEARRLLDDCVAVGIVDGVTAKPDPTIDGLAWEIHAQVLVDLRNVVTRFSANG